MKRAAVQGILIVISILVLVISTYAAEDFTIVILPDTQHYSCDALCGSNSEIFESQTRWIVNNRDVLNIVYVAHAGDIVNNATNEDQFLRASESMSLLEHSDNTSLLQGIPYGVLRGNHDQDSTFNYYNKYFGISRFSGRDYYGGSYNGIDNNNNYGLFSAGGMDFIVVNLEYNPSSAVRNWANTLLATYSNRQAIVVSHSILDVGYPAPFTSEGRKIYDALKGNPNLFIMLCGHMHGEGRRADVYNSSTINTLLADYQDYVNGGNGFLRIITFSPERNRITIKTYSPWLDQYETDSGSQFTLSYDMGGRYLDASPIFLLLLQN